MNKIKKFHNERIKWLWILTLAYIVMLFVIVFVYKQNNQIRAYTSLIDALIKTNAFESVGAKGYSDFFKVGSWKSILNLEATRIGVAFGFGFVLALIVDYVLISKITFIVINKLRPRKQV